MDFDLFSAWPDEARAFARAAERAGRLIRAARRGIAAHDGLSLAEWRLLAVTRTLTGRSQAAIARRLRVSRQAVHTMARGLRSTGCLATGRGTANRKSVQLLLTSAGALRLAVLDETLWTALLEVTNDVAREDLVTSTDALNRFSVRLRRCETIMRRSRQKGRSARRA